MTRCFGLVFHVGINDYTYIHITSTIFIIKNNLVEKYSSEFTKNIITTSKKDCKMSMTAKIINTAEKIRRIFGSGVTKYTEGFVVINQLMTSRYMYRCYFRQDIFHIPLTYRR